MLKILASDTNRYALSLFLTLLFCAAGAIGLPGMPEAPPEGPAEAPREVLALSAALSPPAAPRKAPEAPVEALPREAVPEESPPEEPPEDAAEEPEELLQEAEPEPPSEEPLDETDPPEEAAPSAEQSGASSAVPPETSPPGEAEEEALRLYRRAVLERIGRKKVYPSAARRREQEGEVKLRIVLDESGKLTEAVLLEESRFSLLNEAALKALRRAAPFPPPPEGRAPVTLRFYMAYQLD